MGAVIGRHLRVRFYVTKEVFEIFATDTRMTGPLKDVLLVGYGAVGIIYSHILKRSGLARVTAIARSNYDAARDHGVNIRSQKYGNIDGWRPDRLFRSVAEALDRPYSYVVVATKALPEISPSSVVLEPLLSHLADHQQPMPTFVLLQNGLNVEQDLYDAARNLDKASLPPQILSCAIWIGTNMVRDNVVQHNDFDRVTMGLYKPGNYTDTTQTVGEIELLSDFGAMLKAGGSTLTIVSEIQRHKFAKNFWNLGFASFATLSRHTLPAIFQNPPVEERVVPILTAVLQENLAVGRALGFDETALPSSVVEDTITRTAEIHRRLDSKHTPSMLLDLTCGRPMEIEVIVGEVVRKARQLGVNVPRIETLYALLLIVQGQLLANVPNDLTG